MRLRCAALLAIGALACTDRPGPAPSAGGWVGTAWQVERIAGRRVAEGIRSTLYFHEPGQVSGLAACNRFTGTVELAGDRIASIGPFAATRMMCPPASMEQERSMLDALGRARRLAREGEALLVYGDGDEVLLRLAPIDPGRA